MEIQYIHRVKGEGLVATKFYEKDSVVLVLKGEILDKPTRFSIEIGENKHIVDKYGIYINHSFTPNTVIKGNEVIALKNIYEDDEITYNYNVFETTMVCPFYDGNDLVCGSSKSI